MSLNARYSLAVLLSFSALSALAEDNSNVWLGLKPPSGLSSPHRPIADMKATPPAEAVVPVGESKDPALSGKRIYRDVDTIVGFSKQSYNEGNKVWGRVTGFPSARATIEWTAKQFKAAGLSSVEVQEYEAAANTAM